MLWSFRNKRLVNSTQPSIEDKKNCDTLESCIEIEEMAKNIKNKII
jgi:hypothetical protein